ncbi:hypothetical protein DSO57_1003338 [Entomophthora muscae]|uniref:Uncharacterized protein n=1 Tax=Entomophthora muscae TaxID=34485 RepID=A0ACC2U6L0_9FUNG|nr:hypothetical protein DSO57_1003338 [Entomophthora muscae]
MRAPLVEPRGITNNNLLCYAHSVLQSLIHVPPFMNLVKLLASSSISNPDKTPILHSLVEIYKQFRTSSSKKAKNNREQEPIEPKLIIRLVQSLRPSFSTQIGVQEDAHEFFSALINGLSDEILALMKEESLAVSSNFDSSKVPSIHIFQTEQPSTDSDEAEWVGVGANNKHFISRETKVVATPITSLFSGLYRNTLKVKGKAPSVSQDCSIDLQLEVEPDHIRTVQDALNHLLKAESLDKADPSDDFSAGHVSKHFSFESLPPILVLHLKIVVFCKEVGARKILKDISCPLILSFPLPKKFGSTAESVVKYQLVAVVYHHGSEAMAGHYTCDVRRGDDSWIFCNDSEIEALDYKSIGTTEHTLDGTPYLLFYTRV